MSAVHGLSQVIRDNKIVRVTLKGAFNAEGVKQYEKHARNIISEFCGAPFLMLIDDTDVEGGTPDAYAALDKFNKWQNTQAMVAKAFVVKQSLLKEIILQRTPALNQQSTAFFDNEPDAVNWLTQQMEGKAE